MERQGAEAHHVPKEKENQAGEGWVRSMPKSRVKSLGLAATPEERGRWSPKQTELAEAGGFRAEGPAVAGAAW